MGHPAMGFSVTSFWFDSAHVLCVRVYFNLPVLLWQKNCAVNVVGNKMPLET